MNQFKARKGFHFLFMATTALLAIGTCLLFFCIFGLVFIQGYERLSFDFLLLETRSGGEAGGVFYQIAGTVILIATAGVIVIPFAGGISISYFFSKNILFRQSIRSILHILNATPSIIFGVLGFLFFVKGLQMEKSWVSGGAILALMILPTVSMAFMDRLSTIPKNYVEQGLALGFNNDQLSWAIILPYGWGGILTGLILGLCRAAGETAPIMLTAVVFSGVGIPTGIKDNPVLALPYHIFNLSMDSYHEGSTKSLWATAFVLTGVLLFTSAIAIPFRKRSHEEAHQ